MRTRNSYNLDRRWFATRSGGYHWRIVAVALTVLGLTFAVGADEIQIGPYWYKDLAVQTVKGGKLIHVNAAGTQIVTELQRVGGIKLDAYPNVGKAESAMSRKDDRTALKLLEQLNRKTLPLWLGHWVRYRLMQVRGRLGDPMGSVGAFMELVQKEADPFYFAQPPVAVLDAADTQLLQELLQRLVLAKRKSRGAASDAVDAMSSAVKVCIEQTKSAPLPGATPAEPTSRAVGTTSLPIELLAELDDDDPVTRLLSRGQFQAAFDQVDLLLNRSSDALAHRLYQRGMAQLALADRTGDPERYKSAGLDFMRVIIYRPRSVKVVGAALMEAGYVHQKIGRVDLARKLFDRAKLYIEEGDQSELARRLMALIAAVADER